MSKLFDSYENILALIVFQYIFRHQKLNHTSQTKQQQQRKLRTMMPKRTYTLYTKTGGHITAVMINTIGKYIKPFPKTKIIIIHTSLSDPNALLIELDISLEMTCLPK